MSSTVNSFALFAVAATVHHPWLVLTFAYFAYHCARRWYLYSHLHTVGGPDLPFLSAVATVRFLRDGRALLREGCERYQGRMFKIALFDRWVAVASSPALVDELRKVPEDVMSLRHAMSELLAVEHLFGKHIADDLWHADLVRSQIARKLGLQFHDMHDEIVTSFDDYVRCPDDGDWVTMQCMDIVRKIVCRSSNRIFLGLPKCRDLDWTDLNIIFVREVMKSRIILGLFPSILKPLARRFLTSVPTLMARATRHLEPMILERQQMAASKEFAVSERPNDLLTWILDGPGNPAHPPSPKDLTSRVLLMVSGALHITSMAFFDVILDLAARTQYIAPLREEIEAMIAAHGWTKTAVDKMVKLDSFIKESIRHNHVVAFSVSRVALKPYTFADGTTIPPGTLVVASPTTVHQDEGPYPDASEFMPFRFSDMRGKLVDGASQQLSATSLNWLPFGHGQRACPGRVLAAVELKVMLAHLLVNYDIRTEIEGLRPRGVTVGTSSIPDVRAKVLFRKRQ